MKFSIIVVCLNPGEKLNQTLDSILNQTYDDYEIVVKDGGSRDSSIEQMRKSEHIFLYQEKDNSIYNAMNQAVSHAKGEFILFMNCGDMFYENTVLEETAKQIKEHSHLEKLLLYGDTYSEKNDVMISAAPKITGFTCYRNIPCHQSCIYAARLCKDKPYDLQYKIRADYDHFLWCYFEAKADMVYLNRAVASYEGGGFSESKENRKRDAEEHRKITAAYMSKMQLFAYRFVMLCSLAPIRKWMAESDAFSGIYHKMKQLVYGKK